MFIGNALLLLAAIWCLIYFTHSLTNRPSPSLLPSHSDLQSAPRRAVFLGHSHHARTSLKLLQFKITLTRWNVSHDKLASVFVRHRRRALGIFARWFYNMGTVMGAIGMLVAVAVVLYTCGTSGWILFAKINSKVSFSSGDEHGLIKRSTEGIANTDASVPSRFLGHPLITPIVPGVTVPLSHLPIIIVSVFLSQAFHEFGHAIAAALESLPMLAAGASFTVCIPAAFVSFSAVGMKALSPPTRSRIIAAGPFHNFVFWWFLALIARSGIANVAALVSGYQNVAHVGKVVIGVNQDSPLSLYLPPGAIITELDDTSLSIPDASNNVWSNYLRDSEKRPSIGWCVARTVLSESDVCCTSSQPNMSAFACFASADNSERGCIDPIPVLTKPRGQGRCSSTGECTPDSACVVPKKGSQLMRMTVLPSGLHADETVILWSGPFVEILEEVQVGEWLPRAWILPLWLPSLLSTFWEYLNMATLSLYFLNLLPLPFLDGNELLASFLDQFLDASHDAFMFDIEDLEVGDNFHRGRRTRLRWKARIMRFVPYTMSGIIVLCILFAITNAMQ